MPYDGVNIKANLDEAPSFQGGFKTCKIVAVHGSRRTFP